MILVRFCFSIYGLPPRLNLHCFETYFNKQKLLKNKEQEQESKKEKKEQTEQKKIKRLKILCQRSGKVEFGLCSSKSGNGAQSFRIRTDGAGAGA